jgi:hypothetical protein
MTLLHLAVHDEFLLLYGCRDAFFNTILANEVIVLITFTHVARVFHTHTVVHVTGFVPEAFRKDTQTILTVILLAVGTRHVLVQVKPLTFQALHQEAFTGFFQLIDVFVAITRQQPNVATINVIAITAFTPNGFEIGTVARDTAVGKERFLLLCQGQYLRINRLVLLKCLCQVLGMRQLAFLKLGIDHLAAFLVIRGGIRFTNRRHDKIHSPRQFTAHTMRVRHLTTQIGTNTWAATRKPAGARHFGRGGFATYLARHFL